MALTKVIGSGVEGISNASNATFLTATAAEGVTLAGTLAVTGVHTVGTNAVATSEGGAVTTSVVQGLSKAWINFNGTGTAAISDSYNMDSITDLATGMFKVDLTTAMGNDDYSMTATMNHHVIREDNNDNRTTTAFWLQCYDHNTSPIDVSRVSTVVTGDLA